MAVRDTLDKIEGMVAGARTLPFTERILINDNDLVHYVEELRKDLPKELNRADDIVKHQEEIIAEAKQEAERIVNEAKEYAARMTEESEIVVQAKEKSRTILQQMQEQEKEIIERTKANATQIQEEANASAKQLRDNANVYAEQVFDQLIAHVNATCQSVHQAENILQQALTVFQQAKDQMKEQSRAAEQASAQPQNQAVQ